MRQQIQGNRPEETIIREKSTGEQNVPPFFRTRQSGAVFVSKTGKETTRDQVPSRAHMALSCHHPRKLDQNQHAYTPRVNLDNSRGEVIKRPQFSCFFQNLLRNINIRAKRYINNKRYAREKNRLFFSPARCINMGRYALYL